MAVQEATTLKTNEVMTLVLHFDGKPSESVRLAMKAAGGFFHVPSGRPSTEGFWVLPATTEGRLAVKAIGDEYTAAQKAAVVQSAPAAKATRGAGKTTLAAQKAALVEKLSAQGRTPQDIQAILTVAFG